MMFGRDSAAEPLTQRQSGARKGANMQQFLLFFGGGEGGFGDILPMLLMMVAIFYFLIIRPQKKRERQAKEMRESLEVGDEILTIGGILGRVVSMREDSILIESGSANTKLRITRGAVQTNVSSTERLRERQAEAAKSAAEERDRKKSGKDKDMSAAEQREKELQKKLER